MTSPAIRRRRRPPRVWRDRWTGLSGSLAGKRKVTGAEATDGASTVRPSGWSRAPRRSRAGPGWISCSGRPRRPLRRMWSAPSWQRHAGNHAGQQHAERVETSGRRSRRSAPPRRTRKARLRLSRIDPWSVMKTAFLFSIAAGIVLVVAVYVIWTVIGSSGSVQLDQRHRQQRRVHAGRHHPVPDRGVRQHPEGDGRDRPRGRHRRPDLHRPGHFGCPSSTTWPPPCSAVSRSPSPRTEQKRFEAHAPIG